MKVKKLSIIGVLMAMFMVLTYTAGTVKAAEDATLLERLATANVVQMADVADDFKATQVVDTSQGNLSLIGTDPTPTINVGDEVIVTLDWGFDDLTDLTTNDILTYQLPDTVKFDNVYEKPLKDGNDVVGRYTISDNVIYIVYDDQTFCDQDQRVGQLSFSGKIKDNSGDAEPDKEYTISFPGNVEVKVYIKKPAENASLDMRKTIEDIKDASGASTNIYNCYVDIEANGDNTNLIFWDEMYPGMYLYSAPDYTIYNPATGEYDAFTDYSDTTEAPAEGVRHLNSTINALADGQKIRIHYQVFVPLVMYDRTTAQDYVDGTGYATMYDNGFLGKIPNRATVKSDQMPTRLDRWANIIVFKGTFDKWANPSGNIPEKGLLSWQIIVDGLDDTSIQNGYIYDLLPVDTSYVSSSLKVYDYITGDELPGAISDSTGFDTDKGQNYAKFVFDSSLISYLQTHSSTRVMIEYFTKVEKQVDDTRRYVNDAELFYNGTSAAKVKMDMDYTKPEELDKTGVYNSATAPNAKYTIKVNPASLDLNPNGNDLKLEDVMSTSYMLIENTLKINGNAPAVGEYTYDSVDNKIVFNLEDSKAYEIEYEVGVLLTPGVDKLDASNSSNKVNLYADSAVLNSKEKTFNSVVYDSAGSSSSKLLFGQINLTKVDSADVTKLLSGAEFKLTKLDVANYNVVSVPANATTFEKTTGDDGKALFENIPRGFIYMLQEQKAPTDYDKDSKPVFVAFNTARNVFGNTVQYQGEEYALNVITLNETAFDYNFKNKLTETPDPTPSTPDPTPSTPDPTPSTPDPTPSTPDPTPSTPDPTPTTQVTSVIASGTSTTVAKTEIATSKTEISTEAANQTQTSVTIVDTANNSSGSKKDTTANVDNSVKTGDAFGRAVLGASILMLISLIGVAVITFINNKKKSK